MLVQILFVLMIFLSNYSKLRKYSTFKLYLVIIISADVEEIRKKKMKSGFSY